MTRIRIKHPSDDWYLPDQKRIQSAMLACGGFDISLQEAKALWEMYSESMAAGWMMLPESDYEIVGCVTPYFEACE